MTYGFAQAAEMMEDNLGGSGEFVLVCRAQVAVKQRREVGVRLQAAYDSCSIRMQDSERLSEAMKRRGGKGEREMAQDAVNRSFDEWKRRIPVAVQPTGFHQVGCRNGSRQRARQFLNECVDLPFGKYQRFL